MECTHSFIDTTWSETIDGKAYAIAVHCARPGCNARLSLGPSNDADVPADEIIAAVCAHSDADHAAFESLDGWPWDVTKPLAEQWPWNGRSAEEQALQSLAALANAAAESHLELTGPTDQGQPVSPLTFSVQSTRCAECGHQHGGAAIGFICIGCPCPKHQAETAAVIAQSSDSLEPLDGGMTGYIDQGQLDRLTAMCTPVKTLPMRVVLDGGEPFDVGDHAATQPWADPGASTRMTDAELTKQVDAGFAVALAEVERTGRGFPPANVVADMDDAELVEMVAYSPPGSVRDAACRECGDPTHRAQDAVCVEDNS